MSTIQNLVLAAVFTIAVAASAAPAASQTAAPTTVVLVHGAFADGSSWNEVIPLLQAEGLKVVAVQNPLTSLADDVAFTRRAIDMQNGPIVLVGHSWGGTVITEAGDDERVKALVYVAAFAPSPGETTGELGKDYPTPAGLANPVVDASGFLTLSPETIAQHFAQDVSPEQANLIAVTQGAIRRANFGEAVSRAAWETKPSWYIVAEQDHMIDPRLQRDFAKKINAHLTSLPASHVPMISRAQEVAEVIIEAAETIR
jgi:pimeloyl-ACP methyl ester carboxylesterase